MGAEDIGMGAAAGLAAVLELGGPWIVERVGVDAERRRLAVTVGFSRGARFACPVCGFSGAAVHDTAPAAWELPGELAGWRLEIRARMPRAKCARCGRVRCVAAPWAKTSRRLRGFQANGR